VLGEISASLKHLLSKESPTPQVNVAPPQVSVAAPEVHIEAQKALPPEKKTELKFSVTSRDSNGLLQSFTATPGWKFAITSRDAKGLIKSFTATPQ
jgi:hypothetical protein